ncbi:Crp/Fnr family transcriptional regulator [Pseudonocardia acaciae]|uniref:Crp/Fnr family transcriptional regulator n=1 Tax=Pseudonocardia acaciae TaxID=551276 RepID=UPI00048F8395|nr:Crp/Fnr family transcriptional regulator [Pseudonocardia acaciae]
MEHDTAEAWEFGARLSERARDDLARLGRHRRLPAGAFLFLEGTRSDTVVLVTSGRVKIFRSAEDGTEVVLAVRGPLALVGELAVIDELPRSASVQCMEHTEFLVIGALEFIAFLHAHPQAMWSLLRIISGRLRDADSKRFEFGVYDTLGRVARLLVELSERFGEPTETGVRIALPITQDELASWVGASREAVAKALRALRTQGFIRTERRTVTVLDVGALRRHTF